MGKLYLNSALKSTIVTLGAYVEYMQNLDQEYTKGNKSKTLLKSIRTTTTWGRKILHEMLSDLHPDEVERLVGKDRLNIMNTGKSLVRYMEHEKKGEVDKFEVVVRYKDQAIKEAKAIRELENITAVETDDLMTIITLASASCNLCESTGEAVESCKYRKLFIKYDTQPVNLDPGEGCPYRP